MLLTLKLATNLATNLVGQTTNLVNTALEGTNCLVNLTGNVIRETVSELKEGIHSETTLNKPETGNKPKDVPIFKSEEKTPLRASESVLDYTMNSGGAWGADTEFGLVALEYGITPDNQNHWFIGEPSEWNAPNGNIEVSLSDREEGAVKMAEAAKYMWGYQYPRLKDPRLIRNWCQIKYSEAVYAVSTLNPAGERAFPNQNNDTRLLTNDCVTGGTGYAVSRAILDNKPVYVYAQNLECWATYDYSKQEWIECDVPKLTKSFAGIGTRQLTDKGKQAIRELFANTFSK